MKLKITIILLLAAFVAPLRAYAIRAAQYRARQDSITRALKDQLSAQYRAADSVPILYDLFDISQTLGDRRRYADALYTAATHAGDDKVRLEALRHRANYNSQNDTVLERIEELLNTFPPSNEVEENKLYLSVLRYTVQAGRQRSLNEADKLNELFNDYHAGVATSIPDSVRLMWGICSYLLRVSNAQLVDEYVDSLGNVIHHLDPKVYSSRAVQRYFFTRASLTSASKGDYRRAAHFGRQLLDVVDSLQNIQRVQGREYANYDYERYTCYRRMLGDFENLSQAQIDEYYDSVRAIVDRNPRARDNYLTSHRADIFYALGKGRYAEARDLIRNSLAHNQNTNYRIPMLRWLIECCHALNDTYGELEAMRILTEELSDRIQTNFDENTKARRLITGADSYRIQLINQQQANLQHRRDMQRYITWGSVVVSLVLLGLLLMLYLSNRSTRKVSRNLEEANKKLRIERDRMRNAQQELNIALERAKSADRMKVDFINNMSHEVKQPLNAISEYTSLIVECLPEDKAKYLTKYADNVMFNVQQVLTLVNDVLEVATIENDKVRIVKTTESLQDICTTAIMSLFENGKSSKPSIELVFNPDEKDDLLINTDKNRLVQMLMNLLANAEKFTPAGKITLDYDYNPAVPNTVSISVTDTGCGIPRAAHEIIFQRFRQLDNSVPGIGLGLYIVRRMATLLGGKVTVDKNYTKGARFVITLNTDVEQVQAS